MAADQRYVHKRYAQALQPAMTVAYALPTLLVLFYSPGVVSFRNIELAWQIFPIVVPVVHRLLAWCFLDTAAEDRIHDPWADLPSLRIIYSMSGLISALGHWYMAMAGPLSLSRSILKGVSMIGEEHDSLGDAWSVLLVLEYLALIVSMTMLTMLQFRDLKAVNRLEVGWTKIVLAFVIVTMLCGPGTAIIAAWAYREEILAKRPEIS